MKKTYYQQVMYGITLFFCILFCEDMYSQSNVALTHCNCRVSKLSAADVNRFTANYKSIFTKHNNTRHTEWVFFPRNYFLLAHDFFSSHTDYMGMWLFLGSFHDIVDETQQLNRKQIMIHMVPADKDTVPDFSAFQQFGPTYTYLQDPDFTRVLIYPNKASSAHTSFGPEHVILVPKYSSENLREHYRKRYTILSKKHSTAMFMCKVNFIEIGEYLQKNSGIEGVRVSFASYRKIMDCTHQIREKQITFILSPASKTELLHDDYYNYLTSKFKLADDGFNHGELCPNSCPLK